MRLMIFKQQVESMYDKCHKHAKSKTFYQVKYASRFTWIKKIEYHVKIIF